MTKTKLISVCAAVTYALAGASAIHAADLAPQTRKNLEAALHGEAYANLKYRAYADAARKAGNLELAALFEGSADIEAYEHFAREADALGLAGFDARNVADAMAGENYENTKQYIEFADQADKAGDKKVASLFRQIAADEGDHFQLFKEAFVKLTHEARPAANADARQGREAGESRE